MSTLGGVEWPDSLVDEEQVQDRAQLIAELRATLRMRGGTIEIYRLGRPTLRVWLDGDTVRMRVVT